MNGYYLLLIEYRPRLSSADAFASYDETWRCKSLTVVPRLPEVQ